MVLTQRRREEGKDNVVRLAPIILKTNQQPPAEDNWLDKLPVGTIFLSRSKTEYNLTTEYTILEKSLGDILLRENKREGKLDISSYQWYDTLNFSLKNSLRSTLDT